MGMVPQGKTPTIKHLWPHHRSMARELVFGGLTPGQLAERFNFTPGQITRITNSPMFQLEVARLESELEQEMDVDVREELQRMAIRAVEILDENMHKKGVDEKVKTRTAMDVLDRAGYGKKTSTTVGGDVYNTQINVNELSDGELRDEVIELIEAEENDD